MRNNNFSVREEDEFISVRLVQDVQDDWPFNSPHWSPHKSFTFWECIDIEKGNSFWLPLGSERASSLIAFYCSVKQIFLTCSWSCATIFLVLLLCFLCTSLSAGNVCGYTCVKTWHGPEATQSRSKNSNLGPL